MGFELELARRLAWKQPGAKRVTPAVGVAITGVALSIMVMLLSMAIVHGFKREVQQKIFALDPAITITAYDERNLPTTFDPAEILSHISLPSEAEIEGQTEVAAILKTPSDFVGISLRGNANYVAADSVDVVALSATQASALGLQKGDNILAYFFIDNRLRVRSLRIDSIYSTGIAEHDEAVVFCSPSLPGQMLGLGPDEVQTLGIRGIDPAEVEPLTEQIHSQLLNAYYTGQLDGAYGLTNIYQTDAQYFSWLTLIDTNVIVILALMGAVAAFTLISSLFIIILERVQTIGTLKAMGATNAQIRRVFMLMAERLVLRGLLWGNILALIIISVQAFTHIIPLDPTSYYVDHVPVSLTWWALLGVNLGALLLSWLVLMLPALTIARISPAQTMRYE